MLRRIRLFFSLPVWDQLLLLEVAFVLVVVRPLMSLHMKHWSRLLGTARAETPSNTALRKLVEARRIRWAVETLSRLPLLHADALAQAMTARLLLNRRGIASTFYVGAAYQGDILEAHTWVRVGSEIVTGHSARERFRVVLMYASQIS